jgi:hypothetical protein
MSEVEDAAKESLESSNFVLNPWIATTVAITATFMAIGNIKDGNIVQAMTQVQSRSVDSWSYYQAKSTKQIMASNMAEQLRTQAMMNPAMAAGIRSQVEGKVAQYEADAARYDKEKEEIRQAAENYEKEYDRLNVHDDQFDMAEALLTACIALCGITALTRRRWLFGMAVLFACGGLLLELAGFLQWSFHPEWLARLLG